MSSALRSYAQPLTKQFVAYNSWYYYDSDFRAQFPSADFSKPGFIVFPDAATMGTEVVALANYAAGLTQETTDYELVRDMGKEIKVGIAGGESDIITYRLIQRTALGTVESGGVSGDAATGNGFETGWVLTASRAALSSVFSGNPQAAQCYVVRV